VHRNGGKNTPLDSNVRSNTTTMLTYRLLFVLLLAITSRVGAASSVAEYSSWRDLYTAIAREVLDDSSQDAIFELGLKSIGTFHPLEDGRVLIIIRLGYYEGFVAERDSVRNEPRLRYTRPRFCSKSDLDCLIYIVTYDRDHFQIANRFQGSIVKFVHEKAPFKIKLYERRDEGVGKDVCYEWAGNAFKVAPCYN